MSDARCINLFGIFATALEVLEVAAEAKKEVAVRRGQE
jgi:hypothetical protein